ncbi:hypothetical protein [Flavihumibacter profundi]|uniref:hypothetical protein n=1 Tax=Flavihumibacter profundi TaxID=2716883 RepID=UPI001CC74E4F|nr:hypothetical protein [Flavihumibacter profundi]MBZ5855836.1 hypothetical protein [Flavihumibacter profundi]
MNLAYQELLPQDFAPSSRVWIYQCNRLFGMGEVIEVDNILQSFVKQWQTHGTPVKGFATVFFGQFIIIMADETGEGVSGCSTDSSVRVIKQIEQQFKVTLFDRQLLAFVVKDKVQLIPLAQLKPAVESGILPVDSLYFNNMVANKKELEENWIIPLSKSWLKNRLNLTGSKAG